MKTILGIVMFIMLMSVNISIVNAGDTENKIAASEEKNLKPQTECPVLGGAVDKNLFVDYNGKRIYVCCAGCIETVKADPEKFLKILADKGEYAEDVSKENAD